MKRYINFSLFFILFTSSVFSLDSVDKNSINEIVGHFATAWNHHQGRGFADYYTEDADFINIFGMAFFGKQEIENRHVKILKTFLKDSIFEVTDIKLRETKPGVFNNFTKSVHI